MSNENSKNALRAYDQPVRARTVQEVKMSERANYRKQWAEGEIEVGTLLDAIDSLHEQVEALRKRARTAEREAAKALRTLKGLEKVARVVDANSDQVCGENNRLRAQLEAARGLLETASAQLDRLSGDPVATGELLGDIWPGAEVRA